jgi:hypothetical protein
VRLRTWLRRADIVFKPVAFLAALLAAWVCGYDPEHGRAYPGDLHIAESIVAVLAFAVLVRAVARNVLESLWRPASAPHLAPILREDEVDWLWVAAAILVTVIQFLPIVVGPKGDVGLPAMVVTALVLARVGARLLRRQRVSSTKARKRRARHQSDAGWRVARRSMVLGEYQVPIDYLEYNETNIQALTDEQFARFRSDLKSTIYYAEAHGHAQTSVPAVERKFRFRGGVSQELRAVVPVAGRDRPRVFNIRMTRRTEVRGPRVDAMLFVISADNSNPNDLGLLDALAECGSLHQPTASPSRDIAGVGFEPASGVDMQC